MDNQLPEQQSSTTSDNQYIKLVMGSMLGLMVIIMILLVLNSLKIISLGSLFEANKKIASPPLDTQEKQSTTASHLIAKVGEEEIFQNDYAIEDKYYPNIKSKTKEVLLKKLIRDSKILQAARKDGLITLDESFYNAANKDYKKRMNKIIEVEDIVKQKRDKITGSVVSIWFYNNSVPTTMEAEKAKEFAKNKITPLYTAVKNKQMTIQQAAEIIKGDSSLAQLDKVYKSNAIFDFSVSPNEKISYDEAFDAKIKQLQSGEVSELYMGKDYDAKTRQLRDAIYMFAQIKEKQVNGVLISFEEWYSQREKDYAVTVY